MSTIQLNNLGFQYGNRDHGQSQLVLDKINLTVEGSQSVGIIGANGVGKSTLLKLLVGLLPGYAGQILVDGLEVKKENLPEIRRKIGYVFQDSESQLFMNTVAQDVAFGPRNYGMSQEEVQQRVAHALELCHITELADRHIYRLSGGQKKLAAIATILSMGVEILLMDEPSVALDPVNRENLIGILKDLPCMKLIASHDLDFIYDTCDRVILLSQGQVVRDGMTIEILKDQKLLEENGLRLPLSFRFHGRENV